MHTNSDSEIREYTDSEREKERKSVTFAIRVRTIWIEKVSNFEILVAKLKETLWNVKFATLCRRHKLVAPKEFYLDQNTIPLTLLSRVAYHGDTSHFFGIGISRYQSDTAGIGIFRLVLLYCKIWREHLFKISRELFFWKMDGECTKRGPRPPLLGEKGAPANFLRGSRQSFDTENTDRVFLRYRYGKCREIPTNTDWKIPTR